MSKNVFKRMRYFNKTIKYLIGTAILAGLFLVIVPKVSFALVPQFINYQSRLRDSSDTAITATIRRR